MPGFTEKWEVRVALFVHFVRSTDMQTLGGLNLLAAPISINQVPKRSKSH